MRKKSITLNQAVALLIIGIVLGTIFCIGVPYWNSKVSRAECTPVETQFVSYMEIRQQKRYTKVKEIAIDCSNGERYFIDGVSIDDNLREGLSELSKDENIRLLIHPNSNTIVEFSVDDGTLVPFRGTIRRLAGEAKAFYFLGIFMYFSAVVGLYYITLHVVKKRRR